MQSAKDSIKSFISKAGHHDTTVHESVAPAVKHETIKPQQHEEVTTAIEREVHQDHYHRTVQPVQDREVLPEKHTHNLGAVQHREIDHRDHDSTKHNLSEVASGFKNHKTVDNTHHTQNALPQVAGEHVHHHIHETIQPVVHKETVQPTVVHTTVPIHEVHHKAASHHSTTELPPVSMSEFRNKGGALGGREERYDGFEGEPKNIGGVLGAGHSTGHSHTHGDHNLDTRNTTGTGAGLTGNTGYTGTGVTGNTGTHSNATGTHNTAGGKPSMLKKLNPLSDADGDGKKGFMN